MHIAVRELWDLFHLLSRRIPMHRLHDSAWPHQGLYGLLERVSGTVRLLQRLRLHLRGALLMLQHNRSRIPHEFAKSLRCLFGVT